VKRVLLDSRTPSGDGLLITYDETGGPPHTTRAIPVLTITTRDGEISVCGLGEMGDVEFAIGLARRAMGAGAAQSERAA